MRKILTSSLVFLVSISNVVPYLPQMIQSVHAVGINEVESKKDAEIVQNSEEDKLTEFVDFYQEIEETEDLPLEEGGQEAPSLEEKSETLPSDNETEAGKPTNEMEKNTGSGLIRDLFPDPIVAEEVAGWFNRTVNDIVSIESDLKPFIGTENNHYIEMRDMGIRSIEGLQYFESIRGLILEGNQLTDIGPLLRLNSLTVLDVSHNNITDIGLGPLLRLNSLTVLDVSHNNITNIVPLSELYSLTVLDVSHNNITDIGSLWRLNSLTVLDVSHNNITDISMLFLITELTRLYLNNNAIKNINVLNRLPNLVELVVGNNEIQQLPSEFNPPNLKVLAIDRNQIEDISSIASLKNLVDLNLGVNEIEDLTPLSQLENLVNLRIPKNKITDMRPIAPLIANGLIVTGNGQEIELPEVKLGESYPINLVDYLGNNPVMDWTNPGDLTSGNLTWEVAGNNSVAFESTSHPNVVFNGTIEQEVMVSNPLVKDIFPDPNLAQAVAEEFNRTVNDEISITHELNTHVGIINFSNRQISQLDGMEYFSGVNWIDVTGNQISDLAPLSSSTNLERIGLSSNMIEDVSPLSGLTSLRTLHLSNNQISDISYLSELTSIRNLQLNRNMIEDVSPLSGLTNLATLSLNYNQISDVVPLSELTSIREIWLNYAMVEDVSPLSGLTSLVILSLNYNQISDMTALTNLSTTNIEAINQTINLNPVLFGAENPFKLATLDGIPMQTNFRTDGSLLGNELVWVNSGSNSLTFNGSGETETGYRVLFSGTVTQEVVLDFGLTAVPEKFEFGRSNSISPSLSNIQADNREFVTVEDNRADQLGWRIQVRMTELTSLTNNRLTGTTMSLKTAFTETDSGEVPHLFDTLTINNANRQLVLANPGEGMGKWSIGFNQLTLNVPGSVARAGESYAGNVTWTLLNTP